MLPQIKFMKKLELHLTIKTNGVILLRGYSTFKTKRGIADPSKKLLINSEYQLLGKKI
jgi:hypothetical protein